MGVVRWMGRTVAGVCILGLLTGCSIRERSEPQRITPKVLVVTPVLNYSDSVDWDPLTFTDWLIGELSAFEDFMIVPVNRVRATMFEQDLPSIRSVDDALTLSDALNADAILVCAVTEYDPYDPLRIAMLMQVYARNTDPQRDSNVHPVLASRSPNEVQFSSSDREAATGPVIQLQARYDAARDDVQADVRNYAQNKRGQRSPLDWRVYTRVQELFGRYACWASIRSMLPAWRAYWRPVTVESAS